MTRASGRWSGDSRTKAADDINDRVVMFVTDIRSMPPQFLADLMLKSIRELRAFGTLKRAQTESGGGRNRSVR